MIVDTSALLAILFAESEAEAFTRAIADARTARLSAASYVEAGIRVDAIVGGFPGHMLDDLIKRLQLIIEPVTAEQAQLARAAYRTFGRGNHTARLNYGDCFVYALARATGEEVLFKGEDFSQTDLDPAPSA